MTQPRPIFFYSAYGLTIRSELALPELRPIETVPQADVTISLRGLSDGFNRENLTINYLRATLDSFYMHIADIAADFHVTNGNEILIETKTKVSDPNVRVHLFGTCMGILVQQRDILPLHASCVSNGKECIIISGQCSVGKSTLAMAINKKGYSLLSDDICGIHFPKGEIPYVYPGVPRTRIAADSAHTLKVNTHNLESTHSKFILPVNNKSQNQRHTIKAIFSIEQSEHNQFKIAELRGAQNLAMLIKNTYTTPEFIAHLGKTRTHFEQCTILANLIKVKQIFRTDSLENLPDLISVVVSEFSNTEI